MKRAARVRHTKASVAAAALLVMLPGLCATAWASPAAGAPVVALARAPHAGHEDGGSLAAGGPTTPGAGRTPAVHAGPRRGGCTARASGIVAQAPAAHADACGAHACCFVTGTRGPRVAQGPNAGASSAWLAPHDDLGPTAPTGQHRGAPSVRHPLVSRSAASPLRC